MENEILRELHSMREEMRDHFTTLEERLCGTEKKSNVLEKQQTEQRQDISDLKNAVRNLINSGNTVRQNNAYAMLDTATATNEFERLGYTKRQALNELDPLIYKSVCGCRTRSVYVSRHKYKRAIYIKINLLGED